MQHHKLFARYQNRGGTIIQTVEDYLYFYVMASNLMRSGIFSANSITTIINVHIVAYAHDHDLYDDNFDMEDHTLTFIESIMDTTITVAM